MSPELVAISAKLNADYVGNFDPVRFAFIQSLISKLSDSSHTANRHLLEKACTHAQQYLDDLQAHQALVSPLLEKIESKASARFDHAQRLFQQNQFKPLERLYELLCIQQVRDKNLAVLSDFNRQISQEPEPEQGDAAPLSLDEVLYQQEEQARTAAGYTPPVKNDGRGDQLELQSVRIFRESMKYFGIDRVIERALSECPANPGPHNPHMLAIKSLTLMNDLSPQYLRRMANYLETMIWLEKNAGKLNSTQVNGV